MKIVPKLTVALVAGTCVILAVNGALRVERERTSFEADRLRDHELIGRSLGTAVAAVWKLDGEQAALRTVDAVSRRFTSMRVRWVPVDVWGLALAMPLATSGSTPPGEPWTRLIEGRAGPASWNTYVWVEVDGVRRGVIELSEPATREQYFLRNAIVDTCFMALALAVLSALLSFLMGQWLVGAPVRALSEKARRVGRGDFSSPLALRHKDELADLGREMNAMCDRLVSTLAQLRHADRLATVGTLASGVAHELGTPLNVVCARAGMIAAGEVTSDEAREYANIVVAAAEKMTQIIRRLLQFARRQGLKKARSDLRELANEAVALLRPLADKRGVRLEVASGGGDAAASVDSAQVHQVITNLVMNAIQAMRRTGAVIVSVDRGRRIPPPDVGGAEMDCVWLRVHDEGEGIVPEHLPHLFEPFFTTKDVGEGTGLGLAVAYGIVREHGGWIVVESVPRQGTTFSAFFPCDGSSP
ncbi:MAG: HAMP domain-containing sensor histidine kinase [Polyangiaceae bacterium]|jgi:signal transduction histidine kinase